MAVNNEVIAKAMAEAQNVDELVSAFADQGIEVTAEELEQAVKTVLAEESGELSENDLEDVAGGYSFNGRAAYNNACKTIRNVFNSVSSSIAKNISRSISTLFRF